MTARCRRRKDDLVVGRRTVVPGTAAGRRASPTRGRVAARRQRRTAEHDDRQRRGRADSHSRRPRGVLRN